MVAGGGEGGGTLRKWEVQRGFSGKEAFGRQAKTQENYKRPTGNHQETPREPRRTQGNHQDHDEITPRRLRLCRNDCAGCSHSTLTFLFWWPLYLGLSHPRRAYVPGCQWFPPHSPSWPGIWRLWSLPFPSGLVTHETNVYFQAESIECASAWKKVLNGLVTNEDAS